MLPASIGFSTATLERVSKASGTVVEPEPPPGAGAAGRPAASAAAGIVAGGGYSKDGPEHDGAAAEAAGAKPSSVDAVVPKPGLGLQRDDSSIQIVREAPRQAGIEFDL